jgi:acetamidase/formamidase
MRRASLTARAAAALVLLLPPVIAPLGAQDGSRRADHVLASRPETVTWGWIPTDKAPVLTIRSGQDVRIDTISHHGSTQDADPVTFLGSFGLRPDDILQDVRDFWASRPGRPREGRGGAHVLTGPIWVEGAEPGDMLEVQILEVRPRVPYGFNTGGPTSGVFATDYPGARPGDAPLEIPPGSRHMYRTGTANGREVVFFSDTIQVPLEPFLGIMAVAPGEPRLGQPGVTIPGVQNSTPPGPYGGNMDLKDLTAGSTLYLPVFRRGALFYAGDPHGAQGNGEVSGNALEQSMTAVLRFVVHKRRPIAGPRAETPTHYIMMGIDLDLDRALRLATAETVRFLVEEKRLTPADALSLASLAVDFQVAEAVDQAQLVSAKIPKSLFLSN